MRFKRQLLCFEADGVGGGGDGVAPSANMGTSSAPSTPSYSAPEPQTQPQAPAEQQYQPQQDYHQPEQAEGGQPQEIAATTQTYDGKEIYIEVGPDGKRTLKTREVPAEAEQPPAPQFPYDTNEYGEPITPDIDQINQQMQMPVEPYNLSEFSRALAQGIVDPNRVPPEFQGQYADYVIKNAMAENQRRQQYQAQQEAMQRAQINQELSPEVRVERNKAFRDQLRAEAEARALRNLGKTKEDLADAEFADDGEELIKDFNTEVQLAQQQIMNELSQRYNYERMQHAQQKAVYDDIVGFISQAKAVEPNFDAIDKLFTTRYQTLPYNEARIVADAIGALQNGTITPQQAEVVRRYYEFTRRDYYARRSGLQTQPQAARRPPYSVRPGSGAEVDNSYKPNYGALRSANNKEKQAWISEYLRNNPLR